MGVGVLVLSGLIRLQGNMGIGMQESALGSGRICGFRPERVSLGWNRLSAGILGSGEERDATRCEYYERRATTSGRERPGFFRIVFLPWPGRLFRPGGVEILTRWSHRAADFFLPERKIPAIQLLPFKRDAL